MGRGVDQRGEGGEEGGEGGRRRGGRRRRTDAEVPVALGRHRRTAGLRAGLRAAVLRAHARGRVQRARRERSVGPQVLADRHRSRRTLVAAGRGCGAVVLVRVSVALIAAIRGGGEREGRQDRREDRQPRHRCTCRRVAARPAVSRESCAAWAVVRGSCDPGQPAFDAARAPVDSQAAPSGATSARIQLTRSCGRWS